VAARAQQQAMPVVGFLDPQSGSKGFIVRFFQSLKETGYVEGQNLAVEYRYAENQLDRLPALAADLVRRQVAVIVATGTAPALAAKAATATIPIVFATGGDPVALGLVARLSRPGANATGSFNLTAELASKRLQLLHDLMPNAALSGVLADPASPNTQFLIPDLQAAARTLSLQLVVVNASLVWRAASKVVIGVGLQPLWMKKNRAKIKPRLSRRVFSRRRRVRGRVHEGQRHAGSGSLSEPIAFPATDRPIIAKRDLI
jgi:hypothetical protein